MIVLATGWAYADPLVSLAIGALVIASSWSVLRDSTTILLEGTPAEWTRARSGAMVGVPGVQEVHDLHVWTITSGFPSLSAHVLVPEGDDGHVRRRLEAMLSERFGLTHDAAGRARSSATVPSRSGPRRAARRLSASASERRRPLGSCA